MWLDSAVAALQYMCTSSFVDGIMFAHNGQEYATQKGHIYSSD